MLFPISKSPSDNLKLFWNFFSGVDLSFPVQKPLPSCTVEAKGRLRFCPWGALTMRVERREEKFQGLPCGAYSLGSKTGRNRLREEGIQAHITLAKIKDRREHKRPLSHFPLYANPDLLNRYLLLNKLRGMLSTGCTISEPDECGPCCLGAYSLVDVYKSLNLKLPLGLVCYLAHNVHKKEKCSHNLYTGCGFFFLSYSYIFNQSLCPFQLLLKFYFSFAKQFFFPGWSSD